MAAVKSEPRHDELEIQEMARKIAEQNRTKMIQGMPGNPAANLAHYQMQMARPGQPMIQNFLHGGRMQQQQQLQQQQQQQQNSASSKQIDAESRKGKFGWCEFEKNFIPFIYRLNEEKYTSVRMVERKFLHKFLTVLPPEVNSCHCIRSYYITESECKLLNDINLKHCDCFYGKDAFTVKDLVVKLNDAKEFYRFLDLCHKKLVLKRSNASDRCGFFRINGESVVPYTVKEGVKYVPLFYFEGETEHLNMKSAEVNGWDLAYLKFCCKVQGIRNELFASDVCKVVALEDIKQHFPEGTNFEDYWPAKGSIEPTNVGRSQAGNWTQKPPQSQQSSSSSNSNNHSNSNRSLSQQQQMAAAALAQQTYAAAAAANAAANAAALHPGYQQYIQQQSAQLQRQQQQALMNAYGGHSGREFPGRLTQIKEFPYDKQSPSPAYKLQKALIDQKIVPCINVRPFVFHDLMMTIPDFIRHFCPEIGIDRCKAVLQDHLKIVFYKGNKGHQQVLRLEGKCQMFDPVPLVLVKDIMNYMGQMKPLLSGAPAAKRSRM